MEWLWVHGFFGRVASGMLAGALVAVVLYGFAMVEDATAQQATPEEIAITSLEDGDEVRYDPQGTKVSGNCGDIPEGQEIRVLVNPLATDKWWVQPEPVMEDGNWSSTVYLGTEDSIGEQFKVCAIITAADLSEGDQIPVADFPENSAEHCVTVTTVE